MSNASSLERLEAELREIRSMVAALGGRVTPAALSFAEAAQMLSCSPKHVGRMVRQGLLRPRDLMGARRIPVSQIHALLDAPTASETQTPAKKPRFDAEAFRSATKKLRGR